MPPLDLLIVGAGPGGIALAAETQTRRPDAQILILEKGKTHNWAIRQFYPEKKLTTANYKGFSAKCEGLLCIKDMTKEETLAYFDKIIQDYKLHIEYETEVYAARHEQSAEGPGYFVVDTSRGVYQTLAMGIAIGILGRPNKPSEYPLPASLKGRLLFDITSSRVENQNVLVVGGGDTAAEYVENLFKLGNRVTLSYRRSEFTRLNERNRAMLAGMEERGDARILRSSNIAKLEDDAGRPRVVFKEEAYGKETFDRVVYALGGTSPANFLKTLGIAFNERGPIFDASGETNVPGLFVLGDLVVGRTGGSIMTAFNSAVRVARRLCR